jgi:hypothetical protein
LTFRSWTVAVRDNGIKIKSDKNEKLEEFKGEEEEF